MKLLTELCWKPVEVDAVLFGVRKGHVDITAELQAQLNSCIEEIKGKREEIAKLDYQWRFCGIPDEYESEWQKESSECIKQSCRQFADQIRVLRIGEEKGGFIRRDAML